MTKLLCFIDKTFNLLPVISEFTYKITSQKNNEVDICISTNENFIKNFYSINPDETRELNLQAIVGKNSTGKTYLISQGFYLNGIGIFLEDNNREKKFLIYNTSELKINIFYNGYKQNYIEKKYINSSEPLEFKNMFFSNSLEPKWDLTMYEPYAEDLTMTKSLESYYKRSNNSLKNFFLNSMTNQVNLINKIESYDELKSKIEKLMKVPETLIVESHKINFEPIELINYFFDLENELTHYFDLNRSYKEDLNVDFEKKMTDIIKFNFIKSLIDKYEVQNDINNNIIKEIKSFKYNKDLVENLSLIKLLKVEENTKTRKNILDRITNKEFFNKLAKMEKVFIEFKTIEWELISSGQFNLLNLFERIYSSQLAEVRSVNLFIDEVDLGLHPEWQRRWVFNVPNILFDIFKLKNTNFNNLQIILATHSPILLSDFRKDDVFFLNTSELSCEFQEKTFGANIHDLMSNQFFLEGSLMGEFAKYKIDEIIKLLKSNLEFETQLFDSESGTKYDNKIIKNIISEVGEVYLREALIDLYESSSLYRKETAKKELINKIEQLKKELAEMEAQ